MNTPVAWLSGIAAVLFVFWYILSVLSLATGNREMSFKLMGVLKSRFFFGAVMAGAMAGLILPRFEQHFFPKPYWLWELVFVGVLFWSGSSKSRVVSILNAGLITACLAVSLVVK